MVIRLAVLVGLACPGAAAAAAAIAPGDGATVPSRPTFAFDFVNGAAEIELARSPETKVAGEDTGAFVDRMASQYSLLYSREPPDGLAPWTEGRLAAGRYFWHVNVRDDGSSTFSGTWSGWQRTMTLTVADEPIVFEGWTIRADRARRRPGCRDRVVRLRGTFAFDDNSRSLDARYVLRLSAGARRLSLRGEVSTFQGGFDRMFCTRARSATVTPFLRDARHVVPGPRRRIRLP